MQNGRAFTAYTYAGELSTAAWGFNDAGVSFTLNAVYAKEVKLPGVGRNFVSRSILDAPSFEEAIKRITVPDQATGHNINVIGLDTKSIVTIETGALAELSGGLRGQPSCDVSCNACSPCPSPT